MAAELDDLLKRGKAMAAVTDDLHEYDKVLLAALRERDKELMAPLDKRNRELAADLAALDKKVSALAKFQMDMRDKRDQKLVKDLDLVMNTTASLSTELCANMILEHGRITHLSEPTADMKRRLLSKVRPFLR